MASGQLQLPFRHEERIGAKGAGHQTEVAEGPVKLRLRLRQLVTQYACLHLALCSIHLTDLTQTKADAIALRQLTHVLIGPLLHLIEPVLPQRLQIGYGGVCPKLTEIVSQQRLGKRLLALGQRNVRPTLTKGEGLAQLHLHALSHLERIILIIIIGHRKVRIVENLGRRHLRLRHGHIQLLRRIAQVVMDHLVHITPIRQLDRGLRQAHIHC